MAIEILQPASRAIGPWEARLYRYASGALLVDFGSEAAAVIGVGSRVDWGVDMAVGLVYLIRSERGGHVARSGHGGHVRVSAEVLRSRILDGPRLSGRVRRCKVGGRDALAVIGLLERAPDAAGLGGVEALEAYVRGLVGGGSAVMMPDVLRRAAQLGVSPVNAREAVKRAIDGFHGRAPGVSAESVDTAMVPRGALTDEEVER